MNLRWPGTCFGLVLGCLGFMAALRCEAQINLVPNPGFELLDTCPYTIGFQPGDRPLYWRSWLNSPDYFHACAGQTNGPDSLVDVPLNGWTYQYPWDGDAYVGLYAYDGYSDEYREYVGVELIEPLQVGCTYQLRFRINPAYDGNYWLVNGGGACDNTGMLFTMGSNAWSTLTGPPFAYRNYAHLRCAYPVEDTLAWTEVEGTFTADSAYSYLVLGNFFPDSLTDGHPIGDSWTDITYYLIDGVEVVPITSGCHGVGTMEGSRREPVLWYNGARITVEAPGSAYHVVLSDALGRQVAEGLSTAGGSVVLDAPKIPGLYLVAVFAGGHRSVLKFVVD